MCRVTIFSAPKGFSDRHINIIQRNAIRSWIALGHQTEVVLIGDEPGMERTAQELGVRHIPDVERNDLGTPLVSSIFHLARENSTNEIMIYLNADIILLPDCFEVIKLAREQLDEFMLVGKRWDLEISEELDFSLDWGGDLKSRVAREGFLRSYTAMDYFIFPRQILQDIPRFTVGRAGWDNWMIYNALHKPWPVVDITPSHWVIHQNHDYNHLPEGAAHYDLQESHRNIELAGLLSSTYDLLDVPLEMREGKIRRKGISMRRVLRKMERLVMPAKQEGWRWQLTRLLRKLGRRLDQSKVTR